jgi:spermidine/putrescine-binding protein
MLGGLAGLGAAAAFGPTLAACSSGAASPSPTTAPATPAGTPAGTTGPTPEPSPTPTEVPSPEGELNVYNYDEYIGEDTISSFEEKYGIRVTYDTFTNYEEMTTKISTGNSGYDITFATGVDAGLPGANLSCRSTSA